MNRVRQIVLQFAVVAAVGVAAACHKNQPPVARPAPPPPVTGGVTATRPPAPPEPVAEPTIVPPEPVRHLRDLTRYRTTLTVERSREAQRLGLTR